MPLLFIYLVALIEGFSTLAVEIIAIRIATPVVGSSIILTSIFLGVILLALSAGYYVGGNISNKLSRNKLIWILAGYLMFAGLWYLFITFWREAALLETLLEQTGSYLLTLFVTAIALFFMPVFIASQTLPLLTEIIPEQSKGKAAGKILFASTIGSFLGSVVTSTVLFQAVGVSFTGSIVGASLFGAAALTLLSRGKKRSLICLILMVVVFFLSQATYGPAEPDITYKFDSAYQEIKIRETTWGGQPVKFYHTNNSFASAINTETKKSPFSYIREAVARTEQLEPERILVIGAAGFVYPYEVAQFPYVKQIDTIDIDPKVKRVAEEHFLHEQLPDKITFHARSARFFVNQSIKQGKTYDLILVDAYHGRSIPDELTTVQFFNDLTQLADKDRIVFNIIMDKHLESDFAQNIIATLQHAIGDVYGHNVNASPESRINNFIVGGEKYTDDYEQFTTNGVVYTDNQRTTELDLIDMFWKL